MNLAPALLKRIERTLIDMASFADSEDEVLSATARDARDLITRLPRKAPKKALPEPLRKQAKAKRRQTRRKRMSDIREHVMARAGGLCEACLRRETPTDPLAADHILGGSGRRRARESVETVWAIHDRSCHVERTRLHPNREFWVQMFIAHCERVGLPVPRELR